MVSNQYFGEIGICLYYWIDVLRFHCLCDISCVVFCVKYIINNIPRTVTLPSNAATNATGICLTSRQVSGKVCFMIGLLVRYNLGPYVDVNLLAQYASIRLPFLIVLLRSERSFVRYIKKHRKL